MSSESLNKVKDKVVDFIDNLPWNKDTARVKLKRLIKRAKTTGTLDISYSTFTELPEKCLKLENLTELNISGNKLGANIPKELIASFPNLMHLDCSGNGFTTIDTDIQRLRGCLRRLNIAFNLLGPVLDTITLSLGQLRVLDLQHNKLTQLPNGLGALIHLTTLKLNDNQITALPEDFGELTKLEMLHLQNNRLTKLPDSFAQLKSVTELDVLGNEFVSLPVPLGGLKALTKLDLHGGIIKTIPMEVCAELTHLRSLNLSSNHINALPEEMESLAKVETIDLRNNRILGWPLNVRTMPNIQFEWSEINLANVFVPNKA